jgi:hypothetical protein
LKKYLLAAVAALVISVSASSHADEITVGKSRLEIANDLRHECEEDALYGIGPYAKMSTTQCVAARLRELDAAIAITRPCTDPWDDADRPECQKR